MENVAQDDSYGLLEAMDVRKKMSVDIGLRPASIYPSFCVCGLRNHLLFLKAFSVVDYN
jgi:hypothetical protein